MIIINLSKDTLQYLLFLQNCIRLLVEPFFVFLVLLYCEKLELIDCGLVQNELIGLEVLYIYVLAYGGEQPHLDLVAGLLQL